MLAKLFFVSALLVASSSCYPSYEADADLTPPESPKDDPSSDTGVSRKCTQAGLLCADCTHLVMCILTGSTYHNSSVTVCPGDGNFCSESLLSCSNKLGPCAYNDVFTCHSPGVFPDPYDCNVYYECANSSLDEYAYTNQKVCPPQTAYNAATEECSLPITSDICEGSPVPQCGSSFSAGPLPANANLYYTCEDSKPKLYKCPTGQSFNANTFACESSTFHCPGIGTFVDPKDCHRYYTCNDMEHYTHHSCFIGFYFDEKKNRCVLGTC